MLSATGSGTLTRSSGWHSKYSDPLSHLPALSESFWRLWVAEVRLGFWPGQQRSRVSTLHSEQDVECHLALVTADKDRQALSVEGTKKTP